MTQYEVVLKAMLYVNAEEQIEAIKTALEHIPDVYLVRIHSVRVISTPELGDER